MASSMRGVNFPRSCFSHLGATALALIAGLAVMPAASAADLGKLFFTPQQRADLDRRRQTNAVEAAPVVESSSTVNGLVTRSGGKSTLWVNGVPQDDGYRARGSSRVVLADQPGEIKVGQTVDRTRGEIRDPLQGGRVTASPVPSPK